MAETNEVGEKYYILKITLININKVVCLEQWQNIYTNSNVFYTLNHTPINSGSSMGADTELTSTLPATRWHSVIGYINWLLELNLKKDLRLRMNQSYSPPKQKHQIHSPPEQVLQGNSLLNRVFEDIHCLNRVFKEFPS